MFESEIDEAVVEKFKAKCQETAEKTGQELPKDVFRYAPSTCWKCSEEIIVYSWPDPDGPDEESGQAHACWSQEVPADVPRPKTVNERDSKTLGTHYWVNTCPYCNSIQGDWFLYMEPTGAFFPVDIGAFSHEKDQDLLAMAAKEYRRM